MKSQVRRSRPGRRETVPFDAAPAPCPASASGQPTTTAPDYCIDIKFTTRSGVEALLDCRLQPGKLFAATLLMQDSCDDGGLAAAICSFADLRGHELFENGWELYSGGGHCRSSIGDACVSSNHAKVGNREVVEALLSSDVCRRPSRTSGAAQTERISKVLSCATYRTYNNAKQADAGSMREIMPVF